MSGSPQVYLNPSLSLSASLFPLDELLTCYDARQHHIKVHGPLTPMGEGEMEEVAVVKALNQLYLAALEGRIQPIQKYSPAALMHVINVTKLYISPSLFVYLPMSNITVCSGFSLL